MEYADQVTRTVEDEEDLKRYREMKHYADEGYDVEFRKCGKGYKILKVKKQLISAD